MKSKTTSGALKMTSGALAVALILGALALTVLGYTLVELTGVSFAKESSAEYLEPKVYFFVDGLGIVYSVFGY